MLKNDTPAGRWHPLLFFLTAGIIIIADQATKFCVQYFLLPGQSIPESGIIRFTHVQNTGAAFGILHGQTLLLSALSTTGIIIMLCYSFFLNKRFPILNNRIGAGVLGLVLGGTAGNLIDRLRQGYVTDFIDVGPWPMFNIADSAVSVGITAFALILLMAVRNEKASNNPSQYTHTPDS